MEQMRILKVCLAQCAPIFAIAEFSMNARRGNCAKSIAAKPLALIHASIKLVPKEKFAR